MRSEFGRGSPARTAKSALGAILMVGLLAAACGDADPTVSPPESVSATTEDAQEAPPTTDAPRETTASTSATPTTEAATTAPVDPATTVPVPTGPAYEPPVPTQGPCDDGEFPAVGAADLATGEVRWVTCSRAEVWRSLIGLDAERVFVLERSPDGLVAVAVSAVDGTETWRKDLSQPAGAPAATETGHVVVLPAHHGFPSGLIGVAAANGSEVWRIDDPMTVWGMSADLVLASSWSNATGEQPLIGIERATGNERWRSELSPAGMTGSVNQWSQDSVFGDLAYIGASAVDLADGTVRWTGPLFASVTRAGDVFVGTGPNHPLAELNGVDAANGQTIWEATPGGTSYGGIIAAGDGLVTGLDPDTGEAVAFDLETGEERWRAPAFQPQLFDGGNLISMWEASLDAWSATDGSPVWSTIQPFGTSFMNEIRSDGTTLYVAINSRPWSD